MNIYVTDHSPFESARNLDDPLVAIQLHFVMRVLSAIVEAELSTVWICEPMPLNDPFVRWGRNCTHNRNWLLAHGYGLIMEYQERFKQAPQCTAAMDKIFKQYRYEKPEVEMFLNRSRFHEYIKDPILAYRTELIDIWAIRYRNRDYRWTGLGPPDWYMLEKKNDRTANGGDAGGRGMWILPRKLVR